MPRPKADPETVARALELVDLGCSTREAAETLGITATTVQRWLAKRAGEAPPLVLPAHMAPPPAPPPIAPLDTSNPTAMVEQLIRDIYGMVQADRLAGNMRGAASMSATVAKLSTTLKQLQSNAHADADVFSCPRSELELAEATIDGRIRALAERGPLRCADCSRALSVTWGTALDS